jgi:hypothetical protein
MKKQYETEYFKLFGHYCWYNNDKVEEKSVSEMNEHFKNKKITLDCSETVTTKTGKVVTTSNKLTKTFYQIWSEDPDMKEYKELIFNCNLSKVKDYQYNLFTGFNHFDNIKSKKVKLDTIFEHIRSLVNYNEESFIYYISWLAQLVQQPHILPHTIIIFISSEGVGKDIHLDFLSECIGEKYTLKTEKLELICGKFNSALGGKLLININETDPVESRARHENIKSISTAKK